MEFSVRCDGVKVQTDKRELTNIYYTDNLAVVVSGAPLKSLRYSEMKHSTNYKYG